MAATWIIITVIAIAAMVFIFKSQDIVFVFVLIKKNLFNFLFFGIIIFFGFSLYHIAVTNNLSLATYDGLIGAGHVYFSWLKTIFGNLAGITGDAVSQDWLTTNSTG